MTPVKEHTQAEKKPPVATEEKAPPRKWYDRFSFSMQGIGDAFSASFYFTRMFMYDFEATYDVIRKRISNISLSSTIVDGEIRKVKFLEDFAVKFGQKVKKYIGRADHKHYIDITGYDPVRGIRTKGDTYRPLNNSWKRKLFGILPFTRDIPGVRPDVADMATYLDELPDGKIKPGGKNSTKLYMDQEWPDFPNRLMPESQAFLFARNLTNVLEALVFGAIDFLGYRAFRREMVQEAQDAVHLQSESSKSKVTYRELRKLNNPFIKSELSQNRFKYALRFLGDAAFAWGLKTGIILKLLPYPLEYTVFKHPTSFRSLKNALHDVRFNHLGSDAEKSFELDLQRSVQQCLHDHHKAPLAGDALESYKQQVLQPIAALAVKDQLSFGEIIHVMSGILQADTRLEDATARLRSLVQQRGLEIPSQSHDISERETAQPTPELSEKIRETAQRGPRSFLSSLAENQPAPIPTR